MFMFYCRPTPCTNKGDDDELFTVTCGVYHVDLQARQVLPARRRIQVAVDGHAGHPLQLEHVQHVSDGHDDQVDSLAPGVDGERYRVHFVNVRVSVRDDHRYVGDVTPVAVSRCEHVVLLRTVLKQSHAFLCPS